MSIKKICAEQVSFRSLMLYPLSYGLGRSCQKGMRRALVPLFMQVFMPGR